VLLGVAELAVTALTAYAGYRMLAYGEPLSEAFAKSVLLRGGSSERLAEMHEEDKAQVEKEEEEKKQETQVAETKIK
jgi:hypothetical protein